MKNKMYGIINPKNDEIISVYQELPSAIINSYKIIELFTIEKIREEKHNTNKLFMETLIQELNNRDIESNIKDKLKSIIDDVSYKVFIQERAEEGRKDLNQYTHDEVNKMTEKFRNEY